MLQSAVISRALALGCLTVQCQPYLNIWHVSAAKLERDSEKLAECQGERYPLGLVNRGRNVFPLGDKYGKLLEHSLTPVISKVQV